MRHPFLIRYKSQCCILYSTLWGGIGKAVSVAVKLISYVVGLFIFPKDFVVSDNMNFPLTRDINCLGTFSGIV